jgi:hypothetical protein
MATKKRDSALGADNGPLLSTGQLVTVVIGYPDGGSETIYKGTVVGSSGPLLKIKKEERETVVNTASFYFIKAAIEE